MLPVSLRPTPPRDLLTVLAGRLLAPFPKAPLGWAARALCRRAVAQRPGLPERLSAFIGRRVCLAPSDLPVAFELTLTDDVPQVAVFEATEQREPADAMVAGSLADLVALAEGRADGDSLFFSGQLRISGDTELTLALRNALDDARLDLEELLIGTARPAQPLVRHLLGAWARLHGRAKAELDLLRHVLIAPVEAGLARQAAVTAQLRVELDALREVRRRRSTIPGTREPAP